MEKKKLTDYSWGEQEVFDPGRENYMFEHVIPINVLVRNILDAKSLNDIISILEKAEVAWILTEEDEELTRLRLSRKMPTKSGDEYSLKDPHSRYDTAEIVLI